jgi:hypothetical protein
MTEYEWRIKLDLGYGKTHTMVWLPVADGEFQQLQCTGRLEFRAKPEETELKLRDGDQPLPEINDGPCIQDLVTEDITARKALGLARYGTTLQPHNGRDTLRDAYEEALDLAMYLRQAIYERDHPQVEAPDGPMTRTYCPHPQCLGGHASTLERCC